MKSKKAGASSTNYVLDKLLVPRIENYASNNDCNDTDALVEYLRRNYKEYQRNKLGPFTQMVAKAVQIVQRNGPASKPELQLNGADAAQGEAPSSSVAVPDETPASSGISSSGSDGSDSEADAPVQQGGTAGLNSSLMSMYGKASGGNRPSTADTNSPGPAAAPAFAAPHAVAAAAAKALAAERTPLRAAPAAAAGAPDASEPGTCAPPIGMQQPSTSGRGAEDVAASGKKSRRAEEAGLQRDRYPPPPAPTPRTVTKKARKGSQGGGGYGGGKSAGGGRSSAATAPRQVTYADLGGVEEVLADIRELIEYPLKHPEVYEWLGVEPPRGVLLHGPPGCGKTALANAIANECGVPFLRVSAPEVVSGMSGESEAKLRALFQEASDAAPCILFIDEIDAIAPKREAVQREMERRIVAQMLTCMDDLASPCPPDATSDEAAANGEEGEEAPRRQRAHVVVLGATNRPDALDPALRRAGRFDREITLGIPTEAARCAILKVITRKLRLEGAFDFHGVARKTPGFVGADLMALTKEAAAIAVTRIFCHLDSLPPPSSTPPPLPPPELPSPAPLPPVESAPSALPPAPAAPAAPETARPPRFTMGALGREELRGLAITMEDFEGAVKKVQPSVRREGFTTKPDVTWEDVGSLDEVREELSFTIAQPIAHPERFLAMGLPTSGGVLLFGPPGCGKTLVAKAVANESGANFISIKGPELLNKYVGESERAVRQLFSRARAAHPCVLFFDEMDALAPRRGSDSNQAAERVVNQLLTEMDGVDSRQGIFIIAATNRPDMIDPALLRPGRLDKILYVPLPPVDGRISILRALTRGTPLAADVDVALVGANPRCTGFSGADLAALVREASVLALKESFVAPIPPEGAPLVHAYHFEAALLRVFPSVSRQDQRGYDAVRHKLRSSRCRIAPTPMAVPASSEPMADGDVQNTEMGGPSPMARSQEGEGGEGGADMTEGSDDKGDLRAMDE